MCFLPDRTGTEPALPKSSAAAMGAVDILDIPLPQPLHDQRWTIGFRWREKEMNMIGHQTVGMERHSMGLAGGL